MRLLTPAGVLFAALLVVSSCVPAPGPGSSDGGAQEDDAGELQESDAGALGDADAGDTLQDAGAGPLLWKRWTLEDGGVIEGELVASYDPTLWWNPVPGPLLAAFDARAYAPYPDDRSLRFFSEADVASVVDIEAPAGEPSYRDFLRDNDMVFARPPLTETSFVITGNETYHLEEDGFGDFAWDVERTDATGLRYTPPGLANEDFLVWDEPVLSGVSGEVIEVVSSGADNTPGEHPGIGVAVNNLVGISLGGSYYAYYLHFRQDGIDPAVVVGAQVSVGDVLGRTGNSGVSLEPHVHMVLLWYDVDAGRSYSVPAEFSDVAVGTSPAGPFVVEPHHVPSSGEWLRAPAP
jgi:hypothetical protein